MDIGQDLRYAARTLTRSRAFSLTVILVTALGVGANTAAFSVADFVLRPLDAVLANDTATRRAQLQVLGVLALVAVLLSGVLAAYGVGRWMSALLFGVSPADPATIAAAVGVAIVITVAGSVIPALRAVRVTPMSVLKVE